MNASASLNQDLWISKNLLHDSTYQPITTRVKSDGFIDRKPGTKPVLCLDGKYRHPFYAPKELMANESNNQQAQAIKAYGPYV